MRRGLACPLEPEYIIDWICIHLLFAFHRAAAHYIFSRPNGGEQLNDLSSNIFSQPSPSLEGFQQIICAF